MKRLLFFFSLLLFYACSENHYHDGKFEGKVYTWGNLFNSHTEILTIEGNEIQVEKYSIGGSLAEKLKVSCKQYPDRIEYQESGGVTKVLTVLNNGDLQLSSEIVFHKLNDEERESSIKANSETYTNKHGNETIAMKKEEKRQESEVEIDNSEKVGTRVMVGSFMENKQYAPEFLGLYKNGSVYEVINLNEEIICSGSLRQDGRIISADGKETGYKLKDGILYKFKNGSWVDYEDQTCGM